MVRFENAVSFVCQCTKVILVFAGEISTSLKRYCPVESIMFRRRNILEPL